MKVFNELFKLTTKEDAAVDLHMPIQKEVKVRIETNKMMEKIKRDQKDFWNVNEEDMNNMKVKVMNNLLKEINNSIDKNLKTTSEDDVMSNSQEQNRHN